MADVATTEPGTIRAGDTLTWSKSLSDYPAPTWVLSYSLVNASARHTFSATADGTDHLVSVASSVTDDWAAGTYRLVGQVTDGASTFTVTDLTVTVKPSALAAVESRSGLRRELDVLEAWYGGDRSVNISEKSIGNRALRYWDPAELLLYYQKVRAAVKQEEAAERLASGIPTTPARVLTRF